MSVGCGGKKIKQKTEVKNDMTLSQEKRDNVGKYLFNADEMESIEISGKDLRKNLHRNTFTYILTFNYET